MYWGGLWSTTDLKYLVLESTLKNLGLNPFDLPEVKLYKDDQEILTMMNLVSLYQKSDIINLEKTEEQGIAKLSVDMCPENYQSYGRRGFFPPSTGFMFLSLHPKKKSFTLQKKTKMSYEYAVLAFYKLFLLRVR